MNLHLENNSKQLHRQHNCWRYTLRVCVWCVGSAIRIAVQHNCEIYLRVEEQRFQHLLWSVNKDTNFPSLQMLSARWHIGEPWMRRLYLISPCIQTHLSVRKMASVFFFSFLDFIYCTLFFLYFFSCFLVFLCMCFSCIFCFLCFVMFMYCIVLWIFMYFVFVNTATGHKPNCS
jgi:hypothetical protein